MDGAAASAYQPNSAFQKDLLFAFGGGDAEITLAVLDGPVDRTHECFRGARLTPLELAARAREPEGQALARGSHTASVIFGQPCSSVEGIAPLCRGVLLPIFADQGSGCTSHHLARAIEVAVEHGAQAVHVGSGRFEASAPADPSLAEALEMCRRRGVLVIAAAGPGGCRYLFEQPADSPVLAVRAENLQWLRQSGGNSVSARGVMLPGTHVVGAALEGGVARRSGAGCAAALLTGLVGLMLSRQIRHGRPADPLAIRTALLQGGATDGVRGGWARYQTRGDLARVVDRFGVRRAGNAWFPFDLSA